MENLIAVFNNRNQALQFASYLKRMGVSNKTISTPRELSVSCGLSIIFLASGIRQAEHVIRSNNFSGFIRFYRVVPNGMIKKYLPI